jgi:8-amino-7-oxononanoate synthase
VSLTALDGDLARLEDRGRLRSLAPRRGIDFASNDYLGIAASGALVGAARAALERGATTGSGGSRLLRGNCEEHEALEAEAAAFFGAEAALFFPTGYAANSALLATLPQRGDLILYDELVHASMHEGLRLTRAEGRPFPHNDVDALEASLREWRAVSAAGAVWIAVESVYSMDGDFAPLADLAGLAARHGAVLVVDEAHATGVFGPAGRGLVAELPQRTHVITLHTCGKALGCEGALLAGPPVMRDFLVNRGRGFIFSTAIQGRPVPPERRQSAMASSKASASLCAAATRSARPRRIPSWALAWMRASWTTRSPRWGRVERSAALAA